MITDWFAQKQLYRETSIPQAVSAYMSNEISDALSAPMYSLRR